MYSGTLVHLVHLVMVKDIKLWYNIFHKNVSMVHFSHLELDWSVLPVVHGDSNPGQVRLCHSQHDHAQHLHVLKTSIATSNQRHLL